MLPQCNSNYKLRNCNGKLVNGGTESYGGDPDLKVWQTDGEECSSNLPTQSNSVFCLMQQYNALYPKAGIIRSTESSNIFRGTQRYDILCPKAGTMS
jgi:hypothetical protein